MRKIVSIMLRYFFREIASKLGLVLIFGALGFAGIKAWETATYRPAQATVTGEQIRCELNYRLGGRTIHEATVACGRVAAVKAQSPDTAWIVSPKSYLTIAFVTAAGAPVTVTALRGKLEAATAVVGDTIAILYSPSNPTVVAAPIEGGLAAMLGATLLAGGILVVLSRRLRDKTAANEATESATTGTVDQPSPAPASPAVQPQAPRPLSGAGPAPQPIAFGQQAPVVDYGAASRQVGTVSR
ncbi:hypothetical protein [Rhodoplanes roseus]|uniref:Uncharacterized protein n=1 Tax=Rhodoplanes roseus TaxID=29409 RepID=A0A327L432_9BRAD|nr:hypothetical protein [Rhodoplanes roseus]RAI44755.1 hypothetical protein CH341_07625 [Rhodoplanes roseus]